jgi:hypothetical protein
MLQESLANVPAHRIPAELKIMEMKFDKRRMSERKETEDRLQKKLEDMRPLVKWPSFLKSIIFYNINRGVSRWTQCS